MKYGFIIDNRKCIGCHACTVACKAEHDVPIGVNRTWVKYIEKGEFPNTRRLFSVMRCNHCADAPCVEICPTMALYTRQDGIVDFDNLRCIGCKSCMQACPYDALFIDPDTHTAAKCNYCAHRVEIGLQPSCVIVCPEHAIISGDMDNPNSEISQLLAREQTTARKVAKGTQPKLFYIDGDEISLNPILTEQANSYLWSSQSSGIGHFAKYAEQRISKSNPEAMAQQLAGNQTGQGTWLRDNDDAKVLAPTHGDDLKMLEKAKEVLKEKVRRVYDAPAEGVLWGWKVSAYIWTKAIAAGVFLVPFLAFVFGFVPITSNTQWFSLLTGLIFLLLTTLLLVKDLDQPKRFAYVLLRPQWKSWLVRGGYALAIYGGLLAVLGLQKLFGWFGFILLTLWGCAIFAVLVAVYTAFLFAQAKGRDFWQSPTLVLHMLVHALIAGAASFGVVATILNSNPDWIIFLRKILFASIAFNLLIVTVELVTPHPTEDVKKVVRMIVSGKFSRLFWSMLILGNLLPGLFLIFGGHAFLIAASALVLLGLYIMEHIWVKAPQLIPLS